MTASFVVDARGKFADLAVSATRLGAVSMTGFLIIRQEFISFSME
jgi:hypothetical protein